MLLAIPILMAAYAAPVVAELKPLQGTWKLTAVEGEERFLREGDVYVIKGSTLTRKGGDDNPYLIELDASTNPKRISIYFTKLVGIGREKDGREVRTVYRGKWLEEVGIYTVEGKTLRICSRPVEDDDDTKPPAGFDIKGKEDHVILTYTRQK